MVGVEGKIMTQVVKRNIAALVVAFVSGLLIVSFGSRINAQEVLEDGTIIESTEQQVDTNAGDEAVETEASTVEQVEATEEPTADSEYSFIAQTGDSYTKISRKAVQIFGFDTTTELSGAQIVYLETNLTQLAGSPELEIGEKVAINKETIAQWAEKAKALTPVELARWQVYADNVDFNTDNVGEAR